MDGGNVDLHLAEDPYDSVRLNTESVPIFITICKIGEHCIVDPSAEEEVCSSASLVVGVSNRDDKGEPLVTNSKRQQYKWWITFSISVYITNIRTSGAGSFHMETLNKCLELGRTAGQCLDRVLLRVLREEENQSDKRLGHKEIFGFLKWIIWCSQ